MTIGLCQHGTCAWLALILVLGASLAGVGAEGERPNFRRPADGADLRYWLQNMVWHHGYSIEEMAAATGLKADEITRTLKRFKITPESRPRRAADAPLLVLP